MSPRIAVLAPCHNEAATVAQVAADFAKALPGAVIYVFDNNSTDATVELAAKAGALVRRVSLQGKGNVVRRMFADVEADVYVLVDGDGTYDATAAPMMVQRLLNEGLDMVSGARISSDREAYRAGHRFGNVALSGVVRMVFGRQFKDMLSGYRVFSRRFVKSFPAHSAGFEIETELTVHTLQMRLPSAEVETAYGARPEGSESKLSTIRDGWRILRMIGLLVREERPLQFFGVAGLVCLVLAGLLAAPVGLEYLRTGLVPRFPTLIVAVSLALVALLSFACGLILDTVSRARLEQRRLAYLAQPGPGA
ncbi:MAG TPA: glycosyltransferase [Caulobacteraceae bacterium]